MKKASRFARIATIGICFFIFIIRMSEADIIHFKDGVKIKTKAAWEEDGLIKCYRFGNNVVSYPKSKIEKIEYEEIGEDDGENAKPEPVAAPEEKSEPNGRDENTAVRENARPKKKDGLPEGVKSSGFYEVGVHSMTDAALDHINQGPFRDRQGFRLQLEKEATNSDVERLKALPWIEILYLRNLKSTIDLGLLRPLNKLRELHIQCPVSNYEALADLPGLRMLDFQNPQITSIAFVKNLGQITSLTLHGVQTIEDYSPLAGMTSLIELSVSGNRKDGQVLAPINTLKNLEILSMGFFAGDSLDFIADCRNLRKLRCEFSKNLTDISALRRFSKLEELILWGTNVSSISPLADCGNLQRLDLQETKVVSIDPLLKLKSLRYAKLPKIISDASVKKLKTAHPNATITVED